MRVTLLAYSFPPLGVIGAQRPLRLANHLVQTGHKVTVFAGHPRAGGLVYVVDPTSAIDIRPDVKVIRTPSWHPFKVLLALRDARRAKAMSGAGNSAKPKEVGQARSSPTKTASSRTRLAQRVLDYAMTAFNVPDHFSGWILTTLPMVLLRGIIHRPNVIYVTGPPWTPLVVGGLASRLLGVPLVVDFRDPWTFNPYFTKIKKSDRRLEGWVVGLARAIIVNTESMAEILKEKYPLHAGKIIAIYNGVTEGNRALFESFRTRERANPNEPRIIAHVGTLSPERMPQKLADLLASVAARWTEKPDLVFRLVGRATEVDYLRAAFEKAGVVNKLELVSQLPAEEAKQEQMRAEVLLLLQSGTRIQVPAKIFEYALAGKPIICFSHPDSESARMVQRYDLGRDFEATADPEKILTYLREIFSDANREVKNENLMRFKSDFNAELLTQKMIEVLRSAAEI